MGIVNQLKNFSPKHDFFIGIDSDGTAFDSMEIKHKKAFIPQALKIWNLESISEEFAQVEEFVNLYSTSRGVNRFPGLLMTFEYLSEREDVIKSGVKLPDYAPLRDFINSGLSMSNDSLIQFSEGKNSEFLTELVEWSTGSDNLFTAYVEGLAPFDNLTESLKCASRCCDLMIISAASTVGLKKDWGEAGILDYMSIAAGQEAGSKSEQLRYAVEDKYKQNRILMIGDAPGDMKAAKDNNALFYPIKPGHEVQSWKRFCDEAFDIFINESYAGDYENGLIKEFMSALPNKKTW